jgi:uncharacterized tellurite resistance protein B-like protein
MASKRERNLALLKVLAAAAWADGRLDLEERNRIKERMLAFDLGPGEIGQIDLLLETPVSYARCEELTRELMAMLRSPAERDAVLEEVEGLLRADGSFTEDERELMAGLRGVLEAMSSADHFMARITGVFRRTFSGRRPGDPPGELTEYLKNAVLQRLHDLSSGAWSRETDAATLNRYTLFGAVLGRVADAEDGISDEELAAVREILAERFHLQPPLLDWVARAVQEGASGHMDRQGLLSEFNRISDASERRDLLDAAFAVADADGTIGPGELEELRLISNYLWIDPRDFHEIRLRWVRK